ncbi:MAG TPA: hypothetical protein VFI70_01580 [Nitrososphaeraceae archaeon]|nr:hypothetical protein [Nitrososphaeraceae archaeon]
MGNCNITAAKPDIQFQNDPIPLDEVNKFFGGKTSTYRLNHHVAGRLKGRGLMKAGKVVDTGGSSSKVESTVQ